MLIELSACFQCQSKSLRALELLFKLRVSARLELLHAPKAQPLLTCRNDLRW